MTKDAAKDQGPFRLLVGLKLTEEGRHAFEDAARISKRIPGCVLQVLHVVAPADGATDRTDPMPMLRHYVDETFATLGGAAGVTVAIDLRTGDPVKELTAFAHEITADLIVLGSDKGHRASWDRAPTVERLRDAMSCPIVVTARDSSSRG
jgi:nucleotide-binding universal stress UspA family protein